MQRRFRLRDLDLARREAFASRPLGEPAHEEGLAASVFTSNRTEASAASGDLLQLNIDCSFEAIEPYGESVQPALRDGASTKRVDDRVPPSRADAAHAELS